MTEFDPTIPALSNPVLASAALLVICTTPVKQNDRRKNLIREMVNAGMDDDEAVEFLALAVMPEETVERVHSLIMAPHLDLSDHRQNFFRFANDTYHTLPPEEACTVVGNAMTLSPVFTDNECMDERIVSLRSLGVDCSRELTEDEIVYGRALIALMDSRPFLSPDVEGVTFYSVTDPELVSVIRDSGTRYPELIDFIRERSTVDAAVLREVLESPSPAVRSGML